MFYLFVYFPDAAPALTLVRWTVCVAIHTFCSTLAGIGLVRIWSRTMSSREKPQISYGVPWGVAAIVVHGLYNGCASLAEMIGWTKF